MGAFRQNKMLHGGEIVTMNAICVRIGEKGVPCPGSGYVLIFNRPQIRARRSAYKNYIAAASTDLVDRCLCSNKNLMDVLSSIGNGG
jgi:hypothetical protein